MTPEEIAQRITSKWPNLHMECELMDLEQDIQDAIRQAIQEEREAIINLIQHWGEPYIYQPHLVTGIRQRRERK